MDMVAPIREAVRDDDLVRHGLLMVAFSVSANFFNYLYQLSMGILLSVEQYGILFSFTSILTMLLVFSQAIMLTIAAFTSRLKAEYRLGGVNFLWRLALKRSLLISLGVFALLVAGSPLLCSFLNIRNLVYSVVLFSAVLPIVVLYVNWGTMQGLQRFVPLGCTQMLAAFLKAGLGALLVYLGLGIYGGLTAIPVSFALVFLVTFFLLRNLSSAGNEQVAVSGLGSYAGVSLIAILSLTVLTNIDVVLAKHYFDAANAGNYAAISVLGKIAYYAPAGVGIAMFPKTSALFERRGGHLRLFLKAALLYMLIAGGVVLVYWLFPQLVTRFLFSNKYLGIAAYLFPYGLAMALLAFSLLLMNYLLSISQTKVAYSLLAVALLQVTLITRFHSSIAQLVNIMLICGTLSIVSMLPFYLRQRSKS